MALMNEMSELSGGTEGAMAAMADLTEMGPRDKSEPGKDPRPPLRVTRAPSPAATTRSTGLGRESPPPAASETQDPREQAKTHPLVKSRVIRETPSPDGARIVTQTSQHIFALIGLSFDPRTGRHLSQDGQPLHNSNVTLHLCETALLSSNPSISMSLNGLPIEKLVHQVTGPSGRVVTFRDSSARGVPMIALLDDAIAVQQHTGGSNGERW